MTPLFLIPIGLYAIVATVSAEVALENARNLADEQEQEVTLTETIVPGVAINNVPPTRREPAALATTAGLADPVVKQAFAQALQKQVKENKQQLVQKSGTDNAAQYSEENPGQHFSQADTDDHGGYSAPLGLKDESHNDWMK